MIFTIRLCKFSRPRPPARPCAASPPQLAHSSGPGPGLRDLSRASLARSPGPRPTRTLLAPGPPAPGDPPVRSLRGSASRCPSLPIAAQPTGGLPPAAPPPGCLLPLCPLLPAACPPLPRLRRLTSHCPASGGLPPAAPSLQQLAPRVGCLPSGTRRLRTWTVTDSDRDELVGLQDDSD